MFLNKLRDKKIEEFLDVEKASKEALNDGLHGSHLLLI